LRYRFPLTGYAYGALSSGVSAGETSSGASMFGNKIIGGGKEGSAWASVPDSTKGSMREFGGTPLDPTTKISQINLSKVV